MKQLKEKIICLVVNTTPVIQLAHLAKQQQQIAYLAQGGITLSSVIVQNVLTKVVKKATTILQVIINIILAMKAVAHVRPHQLTVYPVLQGITPYTTIIPDVLTKAQKILIIISLTANIIPVIQAVPPVLPPHQIAYLVLVTTTLFSTTPPSVYPSQQNQPIFSYQPTISIILVMKAVCPVSSHPPTASNAIPLYQQHL